MTYVQGFVAAVPTASRDAFHTHAQQAMAGFKAFGMMHAAECWGDDVPQGTLTSFPLAVKAQADETVVFAWYLWPSKAVHDAAMKEAVNDPRLNMQTNPMPFDGKRVIHGGFEPVLELGARQPGGYVDGFMCAVPKDGREAFRRFAEQVDPIFIEYGATWIMENWGIDIPQGAITDFRRAVLAEPDEAVMFSWTRWPDKATRDEGSRRMMQDPRFADMQMPFDGKRMVFGGFAPLVET
ncbi:MAG: DUF1428 domain-containing protein [Pararhodobacter sp.]|nr:DUF1428 domain-containing protein [Pararhodobacter sp.]